MRHSRSIIVALVVALSGCGATIEVTPTLPPATQQGQASPSEGPSAAAPACGTAEYSPEAIVALPVSGPGPTGLALGGGYVWLADSTSDGGFVARVDPARPMLSDRVRIGWAPGNVLYAEGQVWVAETSGDGSRPTAPGQNDVLRVSAATLSVSGRSPVTDPGGLALTMHGVWAVSGASSLDLLDSLSGRVKARAAVDSGVVTFVRAGESTLYVTSTDPTGSSAQLELREMTTGRLTSSKGFAAAAGPVLVVGGSAWLPLRDAATEGWKLVLADTGQGSSSVPADINVNTFIALGDRVAGYASDGCIHAFLPTKPSADHALRPQDHGDVLALLADGDQIWVLTPSALAAYRFPG